MADTDLIFFVNGTKVVESNPDPEVTLLQYLRKKLRLTGSKLGCGEGGCGACTVMVSRYNTVKDTISHFSVNACLAPVCSLHGLAVTTVEGIGSTRTRLHPVQELLANAHGTQCGFCTPGIVMSMYTLLRNNPHPTREQIEDNFDGNLCRCTGYRPILEGYSHFSKGVCGMGEKCCRAKSSGKNAAVSGLTDGDSIETYDLAETNVCDPSQEPIFPPELKTQSQMYLKSLKFSTSRVAWHRPVTMEELYDLKSSFPTAKLVIGNTEIGIETKFKNMEYPVIIAATHIPELNKIERSANGITFGSSVTLAAVNDVLKTAVEDMPECKTRSYKAFRKMLKWFAGHQIRNVAIREHLMDVPIRADHNIDLTREIRHWRHHLRQSGYLSAPGSPGQHLSLSGKSLDPHLPAFARTCQDNKRRFVEATTSGKPLGSHHKLQRLFVLVGEREAASDVTRKTNNELCHNIVDTIQRIRDAGSPDLADSLDRQYQKDVRTGTKSVLLTFLQSVNDTLTEVLELGESALCDDEEDV